MKCKVKVQTWDAIRQRIINPGEIIVIDEKYLEAYLPFVELLAEKAVAKEEVIEKAQVETVTEKAKAPKRRGRPAAKRGD